MDALQLSSLLYLFGGSGGGHAALLTVAASPQLWNTAIAYVPIVDLANWYGFCRDHNPDFCKDMDACLGGFSDKNTEYSRRSPVAYIDDIAKANRLKIFAGKFDTIVNFDQILDFYCKLNSKHPAANVFLEVFEGDHFVNYGAVLDYFENKGLTGFTDLTK